MEEIWYIACKGLETWDVLIHVLCNLCRLKCFNLTHVTTPALHSQTVSKENTIIMPESSESKAKNHLKPDITNLFSSQATLTLGVVTRIVT